MLKSQTLQKSLKSTVAMVPRLAPRIDNSGVMHLPAPPQVVFPLLCPIREYDWIRGLECRLLHSASGVAELDCLFETDMPGEEGRLWQVSRYEPPQRIEFVCFLHDRATVAMRLSLTERPDGGSDMAWRIVVTALGETGETAMAQFNGPRLAERMGRLETQLRHYLETGNML
ncbi:hypothetical protein JCM14635_04400 [Megalodesulfovibrio paquesii]